MWCRKARLNQPPRPPPEPRTTTTPPTGPSQDDPLLVGPAPAEPGGTAGADLENQRIEDLDAEEGSVQNVEQPPGTGPDPVGEPPAGPVSPPWWAGLRFMRRVPPVPAPDPTRVEDLDAGERNVQQPPATGLGTVVMRPAGR